MGGKKAGRILPVFFGILEFWDFGTLRERFRWMDATRGRLVCAVRVQTAKGFFWGGIDMEYCYVLALVPR